MSNLRQSTPILHKFTQFTFFMFVIATGVLTGSGQMRLFGIVMAFVFAIGQMDKKMRIMWRDFSPAVKWYFFWMVWTILTGMIVSQYYVPFWLNIKTLAQTLVMVFCAYGIALRGGSDKCLYYGVMLVTLIQCLAMFLGVENVGGLQREFAIGENYDGMRLNGLAQNQNMLGDYFWIGLWMGMLLWNVKTKLPKIIQRILILACLALFVLYSTKTGSRQTILAIGFIAVAWCSWVLPIAHAKNFASRVLVRVIVLALLFVIGMFAIAYILEYTSVGERLMSQFDSGGGSMIEGGMEDQRWQLVIEAWKVFKEFPFCGCGFGQFPFYNPYGLFTHSDYFESLTCTGIIGFILHRGFDIGIMLQLIKLHKLVSCHSEKLYITRMMIVLIMAHFLTGLCAPHWYHMTLMTVMSYISGYAERSRREMLLYPALRVARETKRTSA